jgi:kinesin family protein 11
MAGPQRPTSGLPTRRTATRPTARRTGSSATDRPNQSTSLAKTPAPSTSRAQRSPAEQTPSSKNPDRTYEREVSADTSIHVVVRCRGRNEREIQENSGVAVATEGVKGKTVELSMGPNAVSNKTYSFDKVFSSAANQEILYEDVVLPVVNEVIDFKNPVHISANMA